MIQLNLDRLDKNQLMKGLLALLALINLLQLATPKQVFVTYSKQSESKQLYKYFCDLHNEYFVDIGAYDPVTNSNTLGLSTWRGLNIEASQSRARNFLYGRPHQMSYNVAITNVTGGLRKIFSAAEDSESTLLKSQLTGKQILFEENSISESFSGLCTRYYLKKPKVLFMSVSFAYNSLSFNNWNNDLCVPESILTDSDTSIRTLLLSKNYTKMNMIGKKTFYIHNKVLNQFTAKYAVCSQKYNQFREIDRKTLFTKLHKAINSSVSENLGDVKHINYQSVALYPYFVHQKLVSIEAIYRFMNAFSEIKNRPLLIMSYYPQYSKIFLNSKKFTLEKVVIGDENIFKVIIQYPNDLNRTVYIYDHQVGEPIILDDDNSFKGLCGKQIIPITKIVKNDPPKRLLSTVIHIIQHFAIETQPLFIFGASLCFTLIVIAVILAREISEVQKMVSLHKK